MKKWVWVLIFYTTDRETVRSVIGTGRANSRRIEVQIVDVDTRTTRPVEAEIAQIIKRGATVVAAASRRNFENGIKSNISTSSRTSTSCSGKVWNGSC